MPKICSQCGKTANGRRKFCTSCGGRLDAAPEAAGSVAGAKAERDATYVPRARAGAAKPPPPAGGAAVPVDRIRDSLCHVCGTMFEPGSKFCIGCGAKREAETEPPAAAGSNGQPAGPAYGIAVGSADSAVVEDRGRLDQAEDVAREIGAGDDDRTASASANAPDPNLAESTGEAKQVCSSCGAIFESPTKFCTVCGASQDDAGAGLLDDFADGAPSAFRQTADAEVMTPAADLPPRHIVVSDSPPEFDDGPRRRFPLWAIVLFVAFLCGAGGVGAALALTGATHKTFVNARHVGNSGSRHSGSTPQPQPTPPPSPVTTNVSSPPSNTSDSADQQAILDSVNTHWHDIAIHDFTDAYSYLTPSLGGDESSWVSAHEQNGINDVQYSFSVASINGDSATVNADNLQTKANSDMTSSDPSGCMNWTGTYGMVNQGGRWLINSDNLQQNPC